MDKINSLCSILLQPWMRAFDFGGRSRRREYFIFYIELVAVVWTIFQACNLRTDPDKLIDGAAVFNQMPIAAQLVLVAIILMSLIPGLAVQVRRLHDQNRTGWWLLLGGIPFLGHFIVFLLMLAGGTNGDNRFGSNPREV
ncbi:MAG: DUF805 domain-containing protein [Cyanobacteria bacterium SZAS-4]|nr:DUF805 domain-containing protein [Cyanobacteria bacterium SZAS-4]